MNLLILALAPVAAFLLFMYFRDRYEKEPVKLLVAAFAVGGASVLPIILVESFLSGFLDFFYGTFAVFWHSFIVAAVTEEFFKLLFLYLLVWKHVGFNEKFDGIVYAVFVSMGFAAVENVMYVLDYGPETGLVRAITAVPAHFLFGVTMGFYVGLARFYPQFRKKLIGAAFLYPVLLHGIYDFILMSGNPFFLLLFVPFVVFMWYYGIRKMKRLSERSFFRTDFKMQEELLKKNK
ncbi:MAG: PrsW family glutamic-type intramembrane protease [Prolixibacteraceae bacterium]|jgi:RsiW-degrading membrane proteinase PrsW (M82 family)|nr:PrsW family glutamic-type intramembrane protease [Prolixibacteraceae bacterium]